MSSSEFTFTFIVTIVASVFVPGRSREVQTKTEILIVTIIVKVNPGTTRLPQSAVALQDDYFYYESRKRELKTRLMYEDRCDERLKN